MNAKDQKLCLSRQSCFPKKNPKIIAADNKKNEKEKQNGKHDCASEVILGTFVNLCLPHPTAVQKNTFFPKRQFLPCRKSSES